MDYPNRPEKIRCPKCKTYLNLQDIKDRAEFFGECPNENCQKSWFISSGENPGEFYAKPAIKAGKTSDLGSAENIGPSSFEWFIADFKFFKVNYIQGADEREPGKIKPVRIKPIAEIKKIHPLGLKGTIRIDFMFIIQIHPDVGEISFNGTCLVHSENLEKIQATFEKKNKIIFAQVKKDILKSAYPHAKNYAKNRGHKLPPLEFILRNIGDKF